MRLALRTLELELATLRERSRELETRLREARVELDAFHAKGFELARAMTTARRRAEDIEAAASSRAREIVDAAEHDAARRRADLEAELERRRADLDAELERRRREVVEAAKAKARLVAEMRDVVRRFEAAVAETEASAGDVSGGPPPGHAPRRVELDAGPFADYDALADFEQALAALPAVEDVHVRRLEGGRATIALALAPGPPILDELRAGLPYAVAVRSDNGDRLVVDVSEPAAAARPRLEST